MPKRVDTAPPYTMNRVPKRVDTLTTYTMNRVPLKDSILRLHMPGIESPKESILRLHVVRIKSPGESIVRFHIVGIESPKDSILRLHIRGIGESECHYHYYHTNCVLMYLILHGVFYTFNQDNFVWIDSRIEIWTQSFLQLIHVGMTDSAFTGSRFTGQGSTCECLNAFRLFIRALTQYLPREVPSI